MAKGFESFSYRFSQLSVNHIIMFCLRMKQLGFSFSQIIKNPEHIGQQPVSCFDKTKKSC